MATCVIRSSVAGAEEEGRGGMEQWQYPAFWIHIDFLLNTLLQR